MTLSGSLSVKQACTSEGSSQPCALDLSVPGSGLPRRGALGAQCGLGMSQGQAGATTQVTLVLGDQSHRSRAGRLGRLGQPPWVPGTWPLVLWGRARGLAWPGHLGFILKNQLGPELLFIGAPTA